MNISPSGLPAGNYTRATNVTDSEHLKSATTTHYTPADYARGPIPAGLGGRTGREP